MKKKILILGSSGILGKNLVKQLKVKYKVLHNGIKKRKIDLTRLMPLKQILKNSKPDLIINCAAITNLDFCEVNKVQSKRVNVDITNKLFFLKKKNNYNFKFIQISTDQMYNGKKKLKSSENCKPVSFNEYTKQKLAVEKICIRNKAVVIRLNFFSKEKKNIFNWVIKSCKLNHRINLFKDIHFNPISVSSLSKIIEKIIPKILKDDIGGIYNLGCKDNISKSNFCIYVINKLNLNYKNYKIVSSNKFIKTRRPKNMSMNVSKFQKKFKINLPILKNEINNYLKETNVKIQN